MEDENKDGTSPVSEDDSVLESRIGWRIMELWSELHELLYESDEMPTHTTSSAEAYQRLRTEYTQLADLHLLLDESNYMLSELGTAVSQQFARPHPHGQPVAKCRRHSKLAIQEPRTLPLETAVEKDEEQAKPVNINEPK